MNVKFEKVDAVNGLLTVELEKADYAAKVEKALKDLKKKDSCLVSVPDRCPWDSSRSVSVLSVLLRS